MFNALFTLLYGILMDQSEVAADINFLSLFLCHHSFAHGVANMPSTSIYRNCLDTKIGLRYRDFFSKFKEIDVGDILEEVNDTPFDCIDYAENMTIKFQLHEGLKLIFMLLLPSTHYNLRQTLCSLCFNIDPACLHRQSSSTYHLIESSWIDMGLLKFMLQCSLST